MTAVVSCCVGGYDVPKQHVEQSVDCEFVRLEDGGDWDDLRHPRIVAKEPKLRPWRYADDEVGPWIWLDASFQIVSPTFVEEVVAGADLIAQWEHPDRCCVFAEAEFSASLPKYRNVSVVEQANHYRQAGHPARWGLWAAGLIVYREPVDYLADLWWAEINRWGPQDQISQPVALRAAGMRPRALPYGLRSNPWLIHHPHVDGTL